MKYFKEEDAWIGCLYFKKTRLICVKSSTWKFDRLTSPVELQNVEVCDATVADSSTNAGYTIHVIESVFFVSFCPFSGTVTGVPKIERTIEENDCFD